MALPKINLPISELIVPSNGQKIKYRPFSVAEEKVLLIAQESEDAVQEVVAMKQIMNNCLIDYDVNDLALFDFEYIYLLLRSRSVDNVANFAINDPQTGEKIDVQVELDNLEYSSTEGHSKELKINDEYTLFLKYPSINEFIKIIGMDNEDPLVNYFIMTSCLDKLASEDEVHSFAEYTDEDIEEFMDGLSSLVIKDIGKFFETMPKLRHEHKYTNEEGKEQTFVIEGTRSFFI